MRFLRDLVIWLGALVPVYYAAEKCGHRTKRTGVISAFGVTRAVKMPKNESGGIDWCLRCIEKMAIRCAWCGEPIFIGEPVTLLSPAREDFQVPEHAVVYSEDPKRLVGCLGWNCADSGADRAGFWLLGEDGRGMVFRVPSPLELLLASGGSEILIVNNIGDINEALKPMLIPDDN